MNIERTMVAVWCWSALTSGCATVADERETPVRSELELTAETAELDAEDVTIRAIRGAAGCEATAVIAEDGRTAELLFAGVAAKVDATMRQAVVHCQIALSVALPPGTTYALEELSAEGTLSLAAGMTARVEATAHPIGGSPLASRSRYLRGPVQGPFAFFADFADDDRAFSTCTNASELIADLRLTVDNGTPPAAGQIALTRFRPLRIALRPCATSN